MTSSDDVTVSGQRALVMGASGNVGACVARHLAAGGADVRVLLRPSSSTRGIDGIEVDRTLGDPFDPDTAAAAMADRDVVYYCIVDTRAELKDPAPLFATNVEGLRKVLDVAATANLDKFVFLSTIGTVAVGDNGEEVDEDTPFNWADRAGGYIESRRAAEQLVLSYAAERGVPAVVLNVSNPYGPPDWQPRQGMFVQMAALGKMPFYVRGVGAEVVGIDDAADAMLRASVRGRVGQRYIVSERFMTHRDLVTTAADAVGARRPRIGVPKAMVYGFGALADAIGSVLPVQIPMSRQSAFLFAHTSPASHAKATRELGWKPTPTEGFIARAAENYLQRQQVGV
ncbi:NAD-dependent epimerase/dehydratase family protein [Mycolicibacterium parafortuitum]|uniref:NAD-dependent epimerase/dehydratase [Frankia sp. EAN1pec] n=1 Tax=Mycolicibacterium parafortuitum TaxID=39692 RepID=A0A375YEU6_MYCPF|nr:NAD-dependent epimerase/dehydratase family protein [Mycolicibacterium parafortuitum]ORB30094.1 epimerase [Mycolicibacterium parafortuitum]SRX79610.1 NAD-dependent epimerase/dehydratase [Frankia sp. EAN1pec] [Mycolicibacterium parafortuitum]